MRGRAGVGQSRSRTDVRMKNHSGERRKNNPEWCTPEGGAGGGGGDKGEEERLKIVAVKKRGK